MKLALLLAAALLSALVAIATLAWIVSHRHEPEYRMADWEEDDDGVYIGPIQHSNAQCWSKDDPTCHCWCAVCERHNR